MKLILGDEKLIEMKVKTILIFIFFNLFFYLVPIKNQAHQNHINRHR